MLARPPDDYVALGYLTSPSLEDLPGKYTASAGEAKGRIPAVIAAYSTTPGGRPGGSGVYIPVMSPGGIPLPDFARLLAGEARAECLSAGDPGRRVLGISVEEPVEGWLGPDEAAVTDRAELDASFLKSLAGSGCPAVVWRAPPERTPGEAPQLAAGLGLALFRVSPGVPLRRVLGALSDGEGLLRLSHRAVRELLEGAGEWTPAEAAERISRLLGRRVVVEDAVGRLVAGGEDNPLRELLEREELRASRPSGVDETRRDRRDRYARLPDGFLSVPVERWRVAGRELFWVPLGGGSPAGYLWVDCEGSPLGTGDVIVLYWARRVLEGALGRERIRLETELGMRGDLLDDLIAGHYGSVDLLLQRALYLGADLSRGALAAIVDIDEFARYLERRRLKEPAVQELKRRLADAVRLQARQLFSGFLLGPRSDNVILFLPPSPEAPPDTLRERALELSGRVQRYVRGLLPDLTVSVGIGRYREDPAELPEAYSEAEMALRIGHRIKGPSSVSTFEETGTYKLLFRVLQESPEELESFYAETVEPAVRYDLRYGTGLVQTLASYLRNDASTSRTASELFTHRHTIRYRLERIRELTGLDVDRSEDRERLALGIKAMQLLGRAPEEPSPLSDR